MRRGNGDGCFLCVKNRCRLNECGPLGPKSCPQHRDKVSQREDLLRSSCPLIFTASLFFPAVSLTTSFFSFVICFSTFPPHCMSLSLPSFPLSLIFPQRAIKHCCLDLPAHSYPPSPFRFSSFSLTFNPAPTEASQG